MERLVHMQKWVLVVFLGMSHTCTHMLGTVLCQNCIVHLYMLVYCISPFVTKPSRSAMNQH